MLTAIFLLIRQRIPYLDAWKNHTTCAILAQNPQNLDQLHVFVHACDTEHCNAEGFAALHQHKERNMTFKTQ